MSRSHEKFIQLKEQNKLNSPDVVGKAIAGIAVCKDEGLLEINGRFVNWDDNCLSRFL